MIDPIILNLDQSVGEIPNANQIDLTLWQETIRFGCTKKKFEHFGQNLYSLLPETLGTVLMGSGDFHHISLLLIERLAQTYSAKNPIEVVIFDNHPDNMRYPFGIPLWFLGQWSLDVNVSWAKKIGLGTVFRHFCSPDELIATFLAEQYYKTSPIYLSIDKDVLSEDVIHTNWDQGKLSTYHLLDTISSIKSRIVGSDITGELSIWQPTDWFKRLLSSLDKQPIISPENLNSWQQAQHQLNLQLLQALAK